MRGAIPLTIHSCAVFRILNGLMAGLFAFGGIVQYNDPDPIVWMLIYFAAAAICIGTLAKQRLPVWMATSVGVIALLWGLAWSSGASANHYLHMFDSWEMKSAGAEEAREASGLLIIAAWMTVLVSYRRFRERFKSNDV